MNSADKVFKKAEHQDIIGDEENAYVFYMRFFNIMQEVTKTAKYQQDKVWNYIQETLFISFTTSTTIWR